MASICKILACVLFSVWLCAFSFMAFWAWEACLPFCTHHPGVMLVALGVIGETIWEEHKKLKRYFAWMLIAGLLLEMREAVNEDGKVEDLRSANNALEAKLQPRTITGKQIRDFISLTRGITNKIYIKVIVGNEDSETDRFARNIRNMLDVAGFGTNSEGVIRAGSAVIIENPEMPIFSPLPNLSEFDVYFQDSGKDNFRWMLPMYFPQNVPIETIVYGLPGQLATFTKVGFAFSKIDMRPFFAGNSDMLKPGEFAIFIPQKNH